MATTTTTPANERSLSLDRKQERQLNSTITEEHHNSTSPMPYIHPSSSPKLLHLVESTRLALTILVILSGITILSTSADVVSVYNKTHLPAEFLLPLWGNQDIRGEIGILVAGAVVVFASGIGLIGEKLHALRSFTGLHTCLGLAAPVAGLVTSIVGVALQYHINSSTTVSTLQSWSCQWRHVVMDVQPNFGLICKESRVALYFAVLLIPLEIIVLGLMVGGRKHFPRVGVLESHSLGKVLDGIRATKPDKLELRS